MALPVRGLLCLILLLAALPAAAAAEVCFEYEQGGWRARAPIAGPGPVRDVALLDDGRLVASFAAGVGVYDVSDADRPQIIDFLGTPSPVAQLAASRERVMIATEDSVIWYGVFPVQGRPSWSDSIPVGERIDRIALDRDVGVMILRNQALTIIDATDPKLLRFGGSVLDSPNLFDVAMAGGRIYAATQSDGFYIYDAGNPSLPRYLGDANAGLLTGSAICVRFPEVYLSNLSDVRVWDVSDPARPEARGRSVRLQGRVERLAVSKDNVVATTDRDQLALFSTAEPDTVLLLGHGLLPGRGRSVTARDGLFHAAAEGSDATTFALPDARHARLRSQGFDRALRLSLFRDDLAYLVTDTEGLGPRLELRTYGPEAELEPLSALAIVGTARAMDVAGGLLGLSTDLADLTLIDVSEPAAPRYLGIRSEQTSPRGLLLIGDGAYLFNNSIGMVSYDIGDPTQIVVATGLDIPWGQWSWQRWRDFALVGMGGDMAGVLLIDCADPWQPRIVSWLPIPAGVPDLATSGHHLYAVDGLGVLHVYDLGDPAQPRLETSLPVVRAPERAVVHGRYLFVSDFSAGVKLLDISDRTAPVFAGATLMPVEVTDLAVNAHGILLPDLSFRAIQSLSLPCDVVSAAPLPAAPLTVVARPNPFNPRTELVFSLPEAAAVGLAVHDLRGRRVRTLLRDAVRGPGEVRVAWDGRDDGGRPQPSGVYLARLRAAGRSATARLVLVR